MMLLKIIRYIDELKCNIFGHKWKFNFPSIPNKAICSRCKCKSILNLQTLEWKPVLTFENEERTDNELIKAWFF